jgi:hypothetical protein
VGTIKGASHLTVTHKSHDLDDELSSLPTRRAANMELPAATGALDPPQLAPEVQPPRSNTPGDTAVQSKALCPLLAQCGSCEDGPGTKAVGVDDDEQ